MAHQNKVMQSINAPNGFICVDVFCRPDGSFGFEEYRLDAEDGRGWFPIGNYGAEIFSSQTAAFRAACLNVKWLTS